MGAEGQMERRRFLGALTVASIRVALQGSLKSAERTQNDAQVGASSTGKVTKSGEFPDNSTIVLVHAAWADGSCWSNIIGPLERRGLNGIRTISFGLGVRNPG